MYQLIKKWGKKQKQKQKQKTRQQQQQQIRDLFSKKPHLFYIFFRLLSF